MMHTVGTTKNDLEVRVDLAHSGAAHRISQRPHLLTLAGEALSGLTVDGAHLIITQDMGRAIGYDFVIEVSEPETVFYAQLVKETAFTPLTKKGAPASTSLLTIVLRHNNEDGYHLEDVWPGPFRPPLPGDVETHVDSKAYWTSHAYVFEDQRLKVNTITRECPY